MAVTKPTGPAKAAGRDHAIACDVGQRVSRRSREGAKKEEQGIPALRAQEQVMMGEGGGGQDHPKCGRLACVRKCVLTDR